MTNGTILIEATADGFTTSFPTFAYRKGDTGFLKFLKTGKSPDDWRMVVIWDRDPGSREHYLDLNNLKIRGVFHNAKELLIA